MSKTDLEAWLEEVEDIVTDKPEYWSLNQDDLADMAHDLLKLVKKQRQVLQVMHEGDAVTWVEGSARKTAKLVLKYDPRNDS